MKIFTRSLLASSLIIVFLMCSSLNGMFAYAQQISVGTVEMDQVYKEYNRVTDFQKKVQEAQEEVQKLQNEMKNPKVNKEKIQQRMNELQGELVQEQKQMNEDIQEAGAKIAEEYNLDLVVYFVFYKKQNVQLQDITKPVIQFLNEAYEEK